MDARAMQGREDHRAAVAAEALAERHRERRNQTVRVLRAEDPARWTYSNLAKAFECTPELVAAIVQGRTGKSRKQAGR